MCMKPAHTLNTWKARTWAQVAQAVTWDDYALNSDGQVTVKATRGPVIVWGRRSGEGEDMPRLEAPTPSPLEVAAARVNIQAHALAFARAAHGKVRPSVRWKTRLKQSERRAFELRVYAVPGEEYDGAPRLIMLGWSPRGFKHHKTSKTHKLTRRRGHGEKLVAFFPSDAEENSATGFDREGYNNFIITVADIIVYGHKVENFRYILNVLGRLGHNESLSKIINRIKESKPNFSSVNIIRLLKAAAYRAHVLRRVRPVSRRARVPRPLYARPRPPTCPLAPPVA
ncbi:hypothetical protein GCM10010842_00120 [Deinococcus daejeonensis]|uniref:Uncharacterized protein n=2 Tax=Deinococcus daejeonensis TaxID=1007098 RepID=A0ABQ2IU96_9DEIO|nr:hypothetical protein GCM10010842_00120 [Deinococcus daejeonensis]